MQGGNEYFKWTVSPHIFILAFLLLIHFTSSACAEESTYLASLLDKASQKELYKDPYWHTLLHYKKTIGGVKSLIDDPNFFLSKNGKYDPEDELVATIRGFFQEKKDENKHPVCKFIARYAWLKEKLNIDEANLPVPTCRRFNELIDSIKPEFVNLIFPTSHMNSPASMFGHTLLTIETANKSKLLAYAINYSAVTDETFGPLFAVKGLFGFYKGYYSIMPYYAKLQEYSDVDHRDIWEYPLNLNHEEIKRLIMHVYELDFIYSDYYFFDENCSYTILFLLDAARPGLDLTDQCNWWVIPVDTIRIVQKNGLISDAFYRPSKTTKIKYIASLLPEKEQEEALEIVKGYREPKSIANEPISKEDKIRIADLSTEFIQYKYTRKELTKELYLDRFMNILQLRSELGKSDEDNYKIPEPARPDEGHDSNRFALGVGIRDGYFFQEIKYRPAYHDLIDYEKGYHEGAQIVFLNAAIRYYEYSNALELENLDIIDIVSISPRDDFFKPISWKIKTGFTQKVMEDGGTRLVYQINPGGGFAWKSDIVGIWYLMMETDLNIGGNSDNRYAVGIGASTGFIKSMTEFWKIHIYAKNIYYALGDTHNAFEVSLSQNFSTSTDTSISFEILRSQAYSQSDTEAKIYWNIFF
jgi:hypothetical protein